MAIVVGFVCAGVGAGVGVACSGASADPPADAPDFDSGRREGAVVDGALVDGEPTGDADVGPICAAVPCVTQIALGGRHSCALLVDGTVRCWGLNVKGQLGSGGLADGGFDPSSQSKPVPVAPLTGASQISATNYASNQHQTCALAKGAISCWGDATTGHFGGGNMGPNDVLPHPTPSLVVGLTSPSRLIVGGYVDCALLPGGSPSCWGSNVFYGLGLADAGTAMVTPAALQAVSGNVVVDVAIGLEHNCVLLQDQTVKCWGVNTSLQLARPDAGESGPVPGVVAGLAGVTYLTSGREFSCAVTSTGGVLCWGINDYGQLGRNVAGLASSSTPTAVPLGAVATKVTAGIAHACALLADRTVTCWGFNGNGEVGVAVAGGTNLRLPTPVAGLTNVLEISAGASFGAAVDPVGHTCARIEGGTVKCWGANGDGQLGRGTPVDDLPHPDPALVAF